MPAGVTRCIIQERLLNLQIPLDLLQAEKHLEARCSVKTGRNVHASTMRLPISMKLAIDLSCASYKEKGKGCFRMILDELRLELVFYAKKMYSSQLVQATQGNISIRDQASGLICVTPSGLDYDKLTAKDIVVVDENGTVVDGGRKPTTELPLHLLLLRKRKNIHCVMHTHSPYATVFGITYQPLPIVLAEAAMCLGGTIPVAPYQRSGTQAFAELIVHTLGNGMAVIWGNHGSMVVGKNLPFTFSAAHALEDNAKMYLLAKQIGTPIPLPTEEITSLHEGWTTIYGQ